MPLARIDLIEGKDTKYRQTIGQVVYDAMVDILKVPANDRFQVITEHHPDSFIFDPHFFGIERSSETVFIQMALVEGRTEEQKSRFYKAVADQLHARIGLRPEDVFISLIGTGRDDWSFGNGEASLVKHGPQPTAVPRAATDQA